jgi:hypothetical protein
MNSTNEKDKICLNCKYLAWLIAIGQGLRCTHVSKRVEGEKLPFVPSRHYSCDMFEYKLK